MFVMGLYRHEIMLMVTARINFEYTGRESQLYAPHIAISPKYPAMSPLQIKQVVQCASHYS
jgi:hypothetical protein